MKLFALVAVIAVVQQQCGDVDTSTPEPLVAVSAEDAGVQEDPTPVQNPPPPVQNEPVADAGTPPPVQPVDAGTPPPPTTGEPEPEPEPSGPSYAWGRPAGAACEISAECEDGDPRTRDLCERSVCVSTPVADAPRSESDCADDSDSWNYFVTAPPGPFQDEGLQPERYSVPPGAHNGNCESRGFGTVVANDFGRKPGAECETASQCQGTDPCLQNACVHEGKVRESDGKRLGVCKVRVKQDGENRNWVFSDQWDVGTCQDGKATDAGKIHGPCLPDGSCTEGQCSSGREPWARFCR